MKRPRFLLISIGLSSLLSNCSQGDGAGGTPLEDASSSSSTSGPAVDPIDSTPTTTETTGSATTGTLSTATTSVAPESDGSGESGSSTTAETSSSGDTDGSTENCGNSVLDPGEECDDGYAKNSNTTGMCTMACKIPVCGDGLVWQDHEDCDSGPNNNDSSYNGCTTNCSLGPHCGDNIVQDMEECDAGLANGTGESPSEDGVACESFCRFSAKLVFITSLEYTGKDVNGVTGAHQHCKDRAAAAALDNSDKFKAFISAAEVYPADSEQFAHATLPYVRLDGIRVADDWQDLVSEGPTSGITISEEKKTLEAKFVWTGTDPKGELFLPEHTCAGWSSDSPAMKGAVGWSVAGPTQWTSETLLSCDYTGRLYCFEQ